MPAPSDQGCCHWCISQHGRDRHGCWQTDTTAQSLPPTPMGPCRLPPSSTVTNNSSCNLFCCPMAAENAVMAAVSGSTVELTLTNTVKNDQTVTVAYTDPSGADDANAVQTAGNEAPLRTMALHQDRATAGRWHRLLSSPTTRPPPPRQQMPQPRAPTGLRIPPLNSLSPTPSEAADDWTVRCLARSLHPPRRYH